MAAITKFLNDILNEPVKLIKFEDSLMRIMLIDNIMIQLTWSSLLKYKEPKDKQVIKVILDEVKEHSITVPNYNFTQEQLDIAVLMTQPTYSQTIRLIK